MARKGQANTALSRDIRVLNLSLANLNRSLGGDLPAFLPPELIKDDGTIRYLTRENAAELLSANRNFFQLLGYDNELLIGQTKQTLKGNVIDMLIESGIVDESQRAKLQKISQGKLFKLYSDLRNRFGHKVFVYQYIPQDKYTFEELFEVDIDDIAYVDELLKTYTGVDLK